MSDSLSINVDDSEGGRAVHDTPPFSSGQFGVNA
jgi:hypothetical protein